jgi:hypothetical protein
MLAYEVAGDLSDEHLRMGESTCLEAMYRFCRGIVQVFSEHYLRGPNKKDTNRLMATNSARGFPGMLGSIDCMHLGWKNCPFAWQGQYQGHKKGCTVIQAVASQQAHRALCDPQVHQQLQPNLVEHVYEFGANQ